MTPRWASSIRIRTAGLGRRRLSGAHAYAVPQADPYLDCKELRPSLLTRRVLVEPRALVGTARG